MWTGRPRRLPAAPQHDPPSNLNLLIGEIARRRFRNRDRLSRGAPPDHGQHDDEHDDDDTGNGHHAPLGFRVHALPFMHGGMRDKTETTAPPCRQARTCTTLTVASPIIAPARKAQTDGLRPVMTDSRSTYGRPVWSGRIAPLSDRRAHRANGRAEFRKMPRGGRATRRAGAARRCGVRQALEAYNGNRRPIAGAARGRGAGRRGAQ